MRVQHRQHVEVSKADCEAGMCSGCGRIKECWSESRGHGVVVGEQRYCCDACARGLGCVCELFVGGEAIARIEEGR